MTECVLLAGNTVQGFVNYFKEFIGNSYGVYIKGGSGVGKSTFLHQIEDRAVAEGYNVCHVPCSSDPNSYDMVKVYGLNVTVVDATSPHIFEPKCYGIDGEIYDIGRFLDSSKLVGGAGIVKQSIHDKAQAYRCMYNEMRIARSALDNIAGLYMDNLIADRYREVSGELIDRVLADRSINPYHAFCDYVDKEGYHDIRSQYVGDREIVSLKCRCEDICECLLADMASALDKVGVEYVRYHSVLHPNALTAIATQERFYSAKDIGGERICIDDIVDNIKLSSYIPEIIKDRGSVNRALERASSYFAKSRTAHEKIESIYLKGMDFESLEEDKERFIDRLFDR